MAQTISGKLDNSQESSDIPNKEVTVSQDGTKNRLDTYAKIVSASGEVVKFIQKYEDIKGSAGTGSNPTKTFTLATSQDVDITNVYLDGLNIDYVVQWEKDDDAKTVTMVDQFVGDVQTVKVVYNV